MKADLGFLRPVCPANVVPIHQRHSASQAGTASRRRARVAEQSDVSGASLADRLNRIVATVHPADRGPYTNEEIVNGIRASGGPSLSVPYLNHLRRGRRDNPTKTTLEGIARFFQVPVAYLFDDDLSESGDPDRHLLAVVRNAGLESFIELVAELPEETRQSVARIVEDLHRMHGGRRAGRN